MRVSTLWIEKLPEMREDKTSPPAMSLAFRPDGAQLVVCAGTRVFIFDSSTGELVHICKGHKEPVYCVAYAANGKRFASGGADKQVIIWSPKGEGVLKYQHSDSIQSLAYNPVSHILASCTETDFGIWAPEQKSVSKFKVPSKILSSVWSNDGQTLALGLMSGIISIRNRVGEERMQIKRTAPVWALQFAPSMASAMDDETAAASGGGGRRPAHQQPQSASSLSAASATSANAAALTTTTTGSTPTQGSTAAANICVDMLTVGCWDQTLSFYDAGTGRLLGSRKLDHDPLFVSYFSSGEYMLVGGTDKRVTLWTREGIKLATVAERDSWVWTAAARPRQSFVAFCTNDGVIGMHQLVFSTVHGLYQDSYAFRENMTDVVLQNLVTEDRLRIKCREYVKKIAIYKDRVAVQFPERVIIYEVVREADGSLDDVGGSGVGYRILQKIPQKEDCNLLVVASHHFVLCFEKKLASINFSTGLREREWAMESVIRYVKVIGGPEKREGVLVGLKNGSVVKIFLDNPFPVELIKIKDPVRCLDLSRSKEKLAVVDENSTCLVYDLPSRKLLYAEPNATSVAWNNHYEDMLCFSGNGLLSIKTAMFPTYMQKLQGFVVGFQGSKIFCLHYVSMHTVDVPQSFSMKQFLAVGVPSYREAYRVACLGVTEEDWRYLGELSLDALEMDIARSCFVRLRDMRMLSLIQRLELQQQSSSAEVPKEIIQAQVAACGGRFDDAARLYVRCNRSDLAVEVFVSLHMWEQATRLSLGAASAAASAAGGNSAEQMAMFKEIMRRQAAVAEEAGDIRQAAEVYVRVGEVARGIRLLGDAGMLEELMDLLRSLPPQPQEEQWRLALSYFRKQAQYQSYAREIALKLGDSKEVLESLVVSQQWEEAHDLALTMDVDVTGMFWLPFARWLMLQDRFEEAQSAFQKAGRPEEAIGIIEELTRNAVWQRRFRDAASHLFMQAQHALLPGESRRWMDRAECYYAYEQIARYVEHPFTLHEEENLFHCARFLWLKLQSFTGADAAARNPADALEGISRVTVLYALAKLGLSLQCFKVARSALEKLQQHVIGSESMRNSVDLSTMVVRGKAFRDREEMQYTCYKCGTVNPLSLSVHHPRRRSPQEQQRQESEMEDLDCCVACGHPFIRSFYGFYPLPLVEFELAAGFSADEALAMLAQKMDSAGGSAAAGRAGGGRQRWKESTRDGSNVMSLSGAPHGDGDGGGAEENGSFDNGLGGDLGGMDEEGELDEEGGTMPRSLGPDDPFTKQLMALESGAQSYEPIIVNRKVFGLLEHDEVLVRSEVSGSSGSGKKCRFFRRVLRVVPVTLCKHCGHFFHEDDYAFESLKVGGCPFCRKPQ